MKTEEIKTDLNENITTNKILLSKILKHKIFLPIISIIVLVIGYIIYGFLNTESTDNAYVEADITTISPEISGIITAIYSRQYDKVKKGDLIAEIDATNYQNALDKTIAILEQAKTAIYMSEQKITQAKLSISESEQAVQLAKVNFKLVNNELARVQNLTDHQFSTKQLLENSQASSEKAKYELTKAEIGLQASHQNLTLLQSEKEINMSKLEETKIAKEFTERQLNDTKLYAPIDGTLANSFLRVGAFAKTGYPLFSVVPNNIYIKANFKETQINHIKSGMIVDINFDAFKISIKGVVRSFAPATGSKFSMIPTDNATGNFTKIVQRVPVIIDFEIPQELKGKILPGLSVVVKVRLN